MKLSEKKETVLLYTVVGVMLTVNIYFEQWGLAFCLMLMMLFVEIIPMFTHRRVEEFNYEKMRETFRQYEGKSKTQTASSTSEITKDKAPTSKSAGLTKDKQSEAGAVALGVAKTLAKNDQVKALGKMALNSAADRLEEEVKGALKKEKSTDDKDDKDENK